MYRALTLISVLSVCVFSYVLGEIEETIQDYEKAISQHTVDYPKFSRFMKKVSPKSFELWLKQPKTLSPGLQEYFFHAEQKLTSDKDFFELLNSLFKKGLFLLKKISLQQKNEKIHSTLTGDWILRIKDET